MKRSSLWVTSIICLLVATTFAFQNCNNKKFNTVAGAQVKGSLDNMNQDGDITGEVETPECDSDSEIESGQCPQTGLIKFYAIEESGSKTFIGTTEATLQKKNDGKYAYIFSYTVPSEHVCKDVEAYFVHPESKEEILIEPSQDFIMWGNRDSCEDDDTPNPPTPSGSVDIEGVKQDGRLVEVYGKCTSGTNVNFSGDLNELIGKSESCTAGAFKHCDLLSKYSASNQIVAKQGSATDSIDVMGSNPHLVLTFETFTKSGTKGLAVTGKCTPGGQVKLVIYNNQVANVACTSAGTYSFSGDVLVAGLKNRVLTAKLETLFGNVEINADVDTESATLSCAISQTVARTDFCTKQAAHIKGSCVSGLPVQVYVNGNYQNIGYCVGGAFEIKNVLLQTLGSSNAVRIEQKNPYGRSCSDTRNLTQF